MTKPVSSPKRRRLSLLLPLLVFAALAGLFWFALQGGDPSTLPSALIGKPVPQFTLPPVDGLERDGEGVAGFATADLGTGAPTIVNVWASWCVPCHDEHPLLMALAKEPGVRLFGISYKDDTARRAALSRPLRRSLRARRRRPQRSRRHRLGRVWRAGDLCDHGRRQDRAPPCRPADRGRHPRQDPAAGAAGARQAHRLGAICATAVTIVFR